ncbi:hypothetical protein LVA97_32260, partial [Klebsiella pneumoniae]|uniref:hypothetical protein n=1 Tax=Klebsiella pneumoniae TaxID=573 RepID=UPI001E298316
ALVVPGVAATASDGAANDLPIGPGWDQALVATPGSRAFLWTWQARYFHCHFSDRVQHSAFTRALEEVVDRFLVDRGLSIRTMLRQRDW